MYSDRTIPRLHEILAHEPAVRAIARRVLGSDSAADDVVQETWLRALQHRSSKPRSLRAWLVTMAKNLALNVRRADARRTRREHAAARPEGVRWNDAYERREQDRRIVAAVLRLGEPHRSAVLLRFYKGWTLVAIARDMRVSTTAVRKRLDRAFVLLRHSLESGPAEPGQGEPRSGWNLGSPHESPAPG